MKEKHKANPLVGHLRRMAQGSGSISVHTHQDPEAPSYQRDKHIFQFTTKPDKGATFSVDVPECWVATGYKDRLAWPARPNERLRDYSRDLNNLYEPKEGFWWLYGSMDHFSAALNSIPNDARMTFRVILDGHTNAILAEKQLHADTLVLEARWTRGSREHYRKFILDYQVVLHNTNRFGYKPNYCPVCREDRELSTRSHANDCCR